MSETATPTTLPPENSLAAGLSSDHLGILSGLAEYRTYDDGEIVMDDKDPSHDLFLLLDGRASIQGTFEQEISIVDAGTILGELSFLDNKARSATVRSIGRSRYAVISQQRLLGLESSHPEVLAKVLFNISISLCTKLRSTLRMLNALSASL